MALPEADQYQTLLDAARDARDDGDRQGYADRLEAMLALFPGSREIALEYAQALISLKNFVAADTHLLRVLRAEPSNHAARELWATLPFQQCDWNTLIERGQVFRRDLPEAQKELAQKSLIFSLVGLWESGRWDEMAGFIRDNQAAFSTDPDLFGTGVQMLGLISRNTEIEALLRSAGPLAWTRLPAQSPANVRQRVTAAALNRELVRQSGVRVISIGQNCLPYQLAGRWGLAADAADAGGMTPFDLGAFSGNNAAEAIRTDFAAFQDYGQFLRVPNWGGGTMLRHAGAGVHFHHERGPFWLDDDGARFFERWERMLRNWRDFSSQGRRLFVFCLCGEGDLEQLVAMADQHLLGPNARMLVVNVLKEHRPGPAHKRVSYLHAPYPNDYFWVELPNHSSEHGFAFEKGIVAAIKTNIMELVAEPAVSDADYPDYQRRLQAAAEAREDGEAKDGALLAEALLRDYPNDPAVTIEYVRSLRELDRRDDAELALFRAIEGNPQHYQLRQAWVDLPSAKQDWQETVRRGRVLREAFPPPQYPQAWRSLEIEFDFLYDSARWDEIDQLIDRHWDDFTSQPLSMPAALGAINNLFRTDTLSRLLQEAAPQAWEHLAPEALENLRMRADMARQNQELVARTGAQVISIGQNCLPYLLGGRWGLIAPRATPEALQPFDLGGFHNDNVVDAIATDFAAFKDRNNYVVAGAWGGGKMLNHRPTNVGFFHERGPYWLHHPARFFDRIDLMLANWDRAKAGGKRIFVFCYCGAGSLQRLVEMADRHLLGADAQLLIVDVLQEPHVPPAHERVSYIHVPYPRDYTWTKVGHQVSARGMNFELSIVSRIVDLLARFEPEHEAARAAAGRSRMLRGLAQKAREAGHLENAVAAYAALVEQDPGDAAGVLQYAELLRGMQRLPEADAVLSRALPHAPGDFELRRAWAEIPMHGVQWDEIISRSRALRAAFSPEVEPRAWHGLALEIKVLHDTGRWAEAVALLRENWAGFIGQTELFATAVDVLAGIGMIGVLRRLLDAATPQARAGVNGETLDCTVTRLSAALANQALLDRAGARVVPLGQNGLAFLLAARWGLVDEAVDAKLTPFDVGDFNDGATAEMLETDFASFARREQFVEIDAWGGGRMLQHKPTGIGFPSRRQARIGEAERLAFFADVNAMVGRWRRIKQAGPRVFLYTMTGPADLARLVAAAAAGGLLGDNGHLVILDTREAVEGGPPPHPHVTYLHAALPRQFPWNSAIRSATEVGVAYEAKLVQPIVARLEVFARVGRSLPLPLPEDKSS